MPQYPTGQFVGTDWIDKSVQATGTPDLSAAELIRRDDALEAHDAGLYDLSRKDAWLVRAATTANITTSGTQTVDGIALVAGNKVLVKDQTNQTQNGIYVVSALAWARAEDANENADYQPGRLAYVAEGTNNANSFWYFSNSTVPTLGATNLLFRPAPFDRLSRASLPEVSVTAVTTLTEAAFGRQHILSGTGYNLTLPPLSSVQTGRPMALRGSSALTGPVVVFANDGTTRICVVRAGDLWVLSNDGANWFVREKHLAQNPRLAINYRAAVDLLTGGALTGNAWNNLGPSHSFSVDSASSYVEASLGGYVDFGKTVAGTINMTVRFLVDGTTPYVLGGQQTGGAFLNALGGMGPAPLVGLSPGNHTLQAQLRPNSGSNTVFCQPATFPDIYSLYVRILESR